MKQATSTNCIFPVSNFTQVKEKVLSWANRFSTFCFLDNHQYQSKAHSVECLMAAGVVKFVESNNSHALDQLEEFLHEKKKWLFGHLGYDLKIQTGENYFSQNDLIQFPDLFFYQPEVVIQFDEKEMIIETDAGNEEKIFHEIWETEDPGPFTNSPIQIQNRIERDEYISIIKKLKAHILRGDCYEVNFCQEFFAENVLIDPFSVYQKLSAISPNPFSAFYKYNNKYLICASPERFLKKQGKKILSQPIKGTSTRIPDKNEDEKSRNELFQSEKDRSENVMVVDLVRNDLAKICKEATVNVDELFGVYSFPQVFQMISTISGELKDGISFKDIIKATFPMGSMTGAPKKKVMELIARYEKAKRGIFSGAVGYIDPNGDFDFNVVIRSILYNSTSQYLSFQTGSGITFYSDPEKEWEECLLKATAIREALSGDAR